MVLPVRGMSQLSDGQVFNMGTLLSLVYTTTLSPEDHSVLQTKAHFQEVALVFLPLC